MKNPLSSLVLLLFITFSSCGSIKSTMKNIDNNAIKPLVKENAFVITESASDNKYGYHPDYPINIGFDNERFSDRNISFFFNALAGKSGETITYKKIESCCPFPTKKNTVGAGMLDIYEITFEKNDKKVKLYFNIFEKGKIMCPKGFSIKNTPTLNP